MIIDDKLRIKQLENIHSMEKVEEIDVTPFLDTDFEEGKLIIELGMISGLAHFSRFLINKEISFNRNPISVA